MSPTGDLAAAKAGDAAAFEALVRVSLRPAFRLAYAMLHSHEEAEDAVQESTLRAWQKLHQVADDRPFRPWFMAVVANECRSRLRRDGRRRKRPAPMPASWVEPFSATESMDVVNALRQLKVERRLLVVLVYYLDLPLIEASEIAGIRHGTAKSRLHRALVELETLISRGD